MLADDPEVLLIAQPLHGALHGLDVESHSAGQLDRRNAELGRAGARPGHLQQGADHLRLRVAEHQDLDLVLRVTEPPNELGQDALRERGDALDDLAEGSLVEDERDAVTQGDGGRGTDGAVEERPFAEEIARPEDREAALDHADTLEEADPTVLKQVGGGGGVALAEENLSLSKRPAELLEEEPRLRAARIVEVDERGALVGDRGAAFPRIGARLCVFSGVQRHGTDDRASVRGSQTLAAGPEAWSNARVRTGREQRTTKETSVDVSVGLDGHGTADVETPIPFLTHMLEQIAKHGLVDLTVRATGDVEIDGHHTTEDVAFTLGEAVRAALGDKAGITRYGSATLPMDEARATCAIDLSGRQFFVWEVPMPKAKLGTWDTELAEIFFEAFARGCACNLHIVLHAGTNLHHMTEICFKAFARSLRAAAALDGRAVGIPSTKGSL